jgi:hypothetical protein
MMTPLHTDLMKYSAPAAPTAHEREALHALRQTRRAAFLALMERVFSHNSHSQVVVTQPRFNSPS